MAEQAKVPEIRFAGFTDPWEQRKFSDMYEVNNERNTDCELGYDRTLSIATMTFNGGNGAADDSLDSYKVIRVGDIAFEGHANKVHAYGRFVLNDAGDGLMSPRFSCLRPIVEQRYSFWKYYIPHEETMRPILVKATKSGTMMNELVPDDLMRESILAPCLAEQEAIGDCLSQLDSLITLHQRKYDKLVVFKKSMLEKMFPKDGESVPEIRFAGFTDPWEQRKLSEFVDRVTEVTSDENLPRVEYEDINPNSGTLNKALNFLGHAKKGILFQPNDTLYGKLRPYLHNWIHAWFPGVAIGDFWVLRPRDIDSSFLYRLVCGNEFDALANVSAGSKMPRADWNLVSGSSYLIPRKKLEQQTIGSFFSHLDDLITLHQRKLELLQNIKKSLLDKMFV